MVLMLFDWLLLKLLFSSALTVFRALITSLVAVDQVHKKQFYSVDLNGTELLLLLNKSLVLEIGLGQPFGVVKEEEKLLLYFEQVGGEFEDVLDLLKVVIFLCQGAFKLLLKELPQIRRKLLKLWFDLISEATAIRVEVKHD